MLFIWYTVYNIDYLLAAKFQIVLKEGHRHGVKAICEALAQPIFNKPYQKDSLATCSPLKPIHEAMTPWGLLGFFKALSASDGFPQRSHLDFTNLTHVLLSPTQSFIAGLSLILLRACQIEVCSLHHCNPSLILLSYTVASVWLHTKLHSTPVSRAVIAKSIFICEK